MADDLSNFLSDGHHAHVSPEMLEVMGKQAANMFLDHGVSLNEAVVKVASEHDDISAEQVKRVVEFANTATYLALHDKNKTAGAKSSYPQFELADPGRVVQDMSDGARPTVVTPVDVAYGQQPLKEKTSSARAEEALADLFGAIEKKAEIDFSEDTAVEEVMSAKNMLVGLRDSLRHSAEHLDLLQKESSAELAEMAKRHMLGGGSVVDVFKAVEAASNDEEKIASVMEPVIVSLLRDNVATAEEMTAELRSPVKGIVKVSHRIVNREHPMVKAAGAIFLCNQEIEKVAAGLDEVTQELAKVNGFIRENLSARATR